jgi:hypothetical protein
MTDSERISSASLRIWSQRQRGISLFFKADRCEDDKGKKGVLSDLVFWITRESACGKRRRVSLLEPFLINNVFCQRTAALLLGPIEK